MKTKMSSRDKTFWAITIPVLVLFFTFNTLPMIKGFIYSFTNYRGYGSYDYVGLRNYIDLFTDARVGKSYLFTFKYALSGTVLVNVLALIMALGLNSKIRFKSALRGIYFVPNILGGLVIGYIFSFFFTYILPALGNALDIEFLKNSILASEKYAWIGVLIVGVWQAVAMNTIIYISGLQTVPREVYEASMLDGASKWREFWAITFPPGHALCHHQPGAEHQELPDGLRPDYVPDQRRPRPEHRVHLLPHLPQRHGRRTVRLPERKRGALLHCDCGHLRVPDDGYE